MSFAC